MQFPALGGKRDSEDGFGHILETGDEQEINSLDKDSEIGELKKQLSDMNCLQQQLVEAQVKAKIEKNNTKLALRKLEHVEKVASQRIVESMPGANFEDDSNHLAMLLATVLEKDDFNYDIENDKVEPKSDSDFLKRIKGNCADLPDKDAKLDLVRNKVLEKMKRTLRRERRQSTGGSVSSVDSRSSSRTRQRSDEEESDSEHNPKHSRPIQDSKHLAHQSKLPGPVSFKS